MDRFEVSGLLVESVEGARALRFRNDYWFDHACRVNDDINAIYEAMPRQATEKGIDFILEPQRRNAARTAYNLASAQVSAGESLLLDMESLVGEGGSVGVYALARAAIEALGRASMLLDPSLEPFERAAAAFTVQLESLHNRQRLLSGPESAPNQDRSNELASQIDASINSLADEATRLGLTVKLGKEGRPRAVERSYPTFTEVFAHLFQFGHEPVGTGRVLADAYSAIAHADPLVLRTVGAKGPGLTGFVHPWQVGFEQLPDGEFLALITYTLHAHLSTVQRQVDAFDWPPSMWRRWSRHARFSIRKALRKLEMDPDEDSDG